MKNVLSCRAVITIVLVASVFVTVPVTMAQQVSPLDRGLSLLEQGRSAEALPYLKQAATMEPGNLAAQNGLGLALAQTGRVTEAIATFRKALEISPEDSRILTNMGLTYFYNSRYDDAIAAFQRGIRSDPKNAGAHEGLGNTYLSLRQADKAIMSLTTAVNLQPDYVQALGNLAAALNLAGRHEEAVVAARRALALNVNLVPAHYSLGLAYGKLGHKAGAEMERNWLDANAPEVAASLREELVKIKPSYRQIDAPDTSREDFVKSDEPPSDSITLLGESVKDPVNLKLPKPGKMIPENVIQGTWRNKEGTLWLTIRGNIGTWDGPSAIRYDTDLWGKKKIEPYCYSLKFERIVNIRLVKQWRGTDQSSGSNMYTGETVFVHPRGFKKKCRKSGVPRNLFIKRDNKNNQYYLEYISSSLHPLYKVGN